MLFRSLGVGELLEAICETPGLKNLRESMKRQKIAAVEELSAAHAAEVANEEEGIVTVTQPAEIKVAIIGRPNVGKSTLLNQLTGVDRSIVSPIAGTTRDSIHSHYKKFGKELILIDTAGIRSKAKVHENLEFYSVIRAINALDESDIAIIVLDAAKGITHQDLAI